MHGQAPWLEAEGEENQSLAEGPRSDRWSSGQLAGRQREPRASGLGTHLGRTVTLMSYQANAGPAGWAGKPQQ